MQEDDERVADFVANLRHLAKTHNFGQYLNTALRDQLVCGPCDHKCQRDLLSISDLTLAVALQKATAAETADKGIKHIHADITTSAQPFSQELHKMAAQSKPCYCCGTSQPIVSFEMLHVTHVRKWDIWQVSVKGRNLLGRLMNPQSKQLRYRGLA